VHTRESLDRLEKDNGKGAICIAGRLKAGPMIGWMYAFDIFNLDDCQRPISSMQIFSRKDFLHHSGVIRWSDDGQLAATESTEFDVSYVLSAVGNKHWVIRPQAASDAANPCELGCALRTGPMFQPFETEYKPGRTTDYNKWSRVIPTCVPIDDSHHIMFLCAQWCARQVNTEYQTDLVVIPGMGPIVEDRSIAGTTGITRDGDYLLVQEYAAGMSQHATWVHDLQTNRAQRIDAQAPNVYNNLRNYITFARNKSYMAIIEQDATQDRSLALHICPATEMLKPMRSRLAWMAAATSLRALRATRAHPLRDCLLRPDTLGAILAMAGPLVGAAPCARVTATLKMVTPMAQRLPDTRWGTAQIAYSSVREMDAYIEDLFK
jgi:hypothetical protein